MYNLLGVIFDMDGLLFDTESIYYESTQKVADQLGIPYTKKLHLNYVGISDHELFESYHKIFKEFGLVKIDEFISKTYKEVYRQFNAGNVMLKPGALDLLEMLSKNNIKMAIATSNTPFVVDLLLKKNNISHYFSKIITCEDVKKAKPDPEIYQVALSRLEMKPERVLVLEDSFHGVTAAYQAGISVIMIPDLLAPTIEIGNKTMAIFESLSGVETFIENKLK